VTGRQAGYGDGPIWANLPGVGHRRSRSGRLVRPHLFAFVGHPFYSYRCAGTGRRAPPRGRKTRGPAQVGAHVIVLRQAGAGLGEGPARTDAEVRSPLSRVSTLRLSRVRPFRPSPASHPTRRWYFARGRCHDRRGCTRTDWCEPPPPVPTPPPNALYLSRPKCRPPASSEVTSSPPPHTHGAADGAVRHGAADGAVSARRLPWHCPSYPVDNAAVHATERALNDCLTPRHPAHLLQGSEEEPCHALSPAGSRWTAPDRVAGDAVRPRSFPAVCYRVTVRMTLLLSPLQPPANPAFPGPLS
jgi:hypothetical protein